MKNPRLLTLFIDPKYSDVINIIFNILLVYEINIK